jgi:hypothetical protein
VNKIGGFIAADEYLTYISVRKFAFYESIEKLAKVVRTNL